MTIAIHFERTHTEGPLRGFRADSDHAAGTGNDGLTASERRELAENYLAGAASFTRQDLTAAHAMRARMRKSASRADLA